VIRHVKKALIVEVHTADTSSLGDPHNNHDDSMDASDNGGEVQGDGDYLNQIKAQKMLGLVVF
jgi:hypothetical protein